MPTFFIAWGLLNLLVAQVGANWFTIPGGTFMRNGSVLSMFLWIALAVFAYRIRPAVCLPIAMILLLQAWQMVSVYAAGAQIGRMRDFNAFDVLFLRYLALYFTAAILAQIDARLRRWLVWLVFAPVVVHGVVAYLQFAHFGPALRLAELNVDQAQDITNWDARGGLRAVGMHGYPGPMALTAVCAAAVLAGLQVARRLRWYEHAGFVFFAGAALIPQARTHLPALGVVILVYLVSLVVRERGRSVVPIGVFVAVSAIMFTLGAENLQYAFGENWLNAGNAEYRQRVAWAGAQMAQQNFPWTGIGADPGFFGDTSTRGDKWAGTIAFDNGWLALAASFGLIGQALFAIGLVAGLFGAFLVSRHPLETDERRGLVVGGALMALALGVGMMGNNVIHWLAAMNAIAIMTGLSMRSYGEQLFAQSGFRRARVTPVPPSAKGQTRPELQPPRRPDAFAARERT